MLALSGICSYVATKMEECLDVNINRGKHGNNGFVLHGYHCKQMSAGYYADVFTDFEEEA